MNRSDMSAAERIQHRREHAVDPEAFLLDAGVVQTTDDETELAFDPAFIDRVREEFARLEQESVGPELLAELFDVDETDVERADKPYLAYKIIYTVRSWSSEEALTLDGATHVALQSTTANWMDVPARQRYSILRSLRLFHEECLSCSARLAISDEPVESCCHDRQVVTLDCTGCGRRFAELSTEKGSEITVESGS